jgi:uncharacterized phiE125 gp8 family phage protein
MGLKRTVDPASLAVSLVDAKKQVEIGDTDTTHDDHLIRLIKVATGEVERHTRRALITQTWKLTLREFPGYSPVNRTKVYLPRPPLQSITSIVYVDANGNTQTLSSSAYQVADDSHPAFIEPAFGESWPVLRPETSEAVSITYVAGFGSSAASVPVEYQNVIFELVAFRFMNRGDTNQQIPSHIKWAMDSLKCGAQYDYFGVKG